MNINDAFPSKYLKASDLGEHQPVVTISHIEMEAVGQKKEIRPILYFAGKDKGLVLNKTNATKITSLLGTGDTDEWPGQKIRLYATETTFAGDTVDCIRVKAAEAGTKDKIRMGDGKKKAAKPRAKPEPEPELDDDTDLDDDIGGDVDDDMIPF